MIRLLLDFPWSIDAASEPGSPSRKAIRDYEQFRARLHLKPVEFIDEQERSLFMEKLAPGRDKPHGSWIGTVLRFIAHHSINQAAGVYHATPLNGPGDLRDTWKRVLRDEMDNLNNWRTPQIIVCVERSAEWKKCVHDHEVKIALEDLPNNGPQTRVVVFIGSYAHLEAHKHEQDYRTHKYALADIDPWDVRHCNQPSGDGSPDERCRLPRPRRLSGVVLSELDKELPSLRSESWPQGGKYWFVPPASWSHEKDKNAWRKGAFEEKTAPNDRKGPIDYKSQIWSWHPQEGHWDVQLKDGGHQKVKPNGDAWK